MNYLRKRLYEMRKKRNTGTSKTVQGQSLNITDAVSSDVDEFVIYGSTRQEWSATALSPDNPKEILTANGFNLTVNHMKNEITDEYMKKFWDKTQWSYNKDRDDWNNSVYYRSPILKLKGNTPYTLYKSYYGKTKPRLNFPLTVTFYGGGRYADKPDDSNSGWNFGLWHTDAIYSRFHRFTERADGEFTFHVADVEYNNAIKKNSAMMNGMVITEGTYTIDQMQQDNITIPSEITLDNGTTLKLYMRSVPNSNGEFCIGDSIEMHENKVYYVQRCRKITLEEDGINVNYYSTIENNSSTVCTVKVNVSAYGGAMPQNYTTLNVVPVSNCFKGCLKKSTNDIYTTFLGVQGDWAGALQFRIDRTVIDSYDSTLSNSAKVKKYFKDLYDAGKAVTVVYPLATAKTTEITNSDLGRKLLSFRLKQHNTISTDNFYCNQIKLKYKAR